MKNKSLLYGISLLTAPIAGALLVCGFIGLVINKDIFIINGEILFILGLLFLIISYICLNEHSKL